jgi:hypothetical protein
MPPKREGEALFLNIFSFLYAGMLFLAFALTAYRELLDSRYVWYILSGIFLPPIAVIAEGDGILPTVFFAGLCGLLDLVIFIILIVGWIQQGSFYLNLSANDAWFGLYALLALLIILIATSGLLIYFLLKSRKPASKYV